jgi:hypothetical protein
LGRAGVVALGGLAAPLALGGPAVSRSRAIELESLPPNDLYEPGPLSTHGMLSRAASRSGWGLKPDGVAGCLRHRFDVFFSPECVPSTRRLAANGSEAIREKLLAKSCSRKAAREKLLANCGAARSEALAVRSKVITVAQSYAGAEFQSEVHSLIGY